MKLIEKEFMVTLWGPLVDIATGNLKLCNSTVRRFFSIPRRNSTVFISVHDRKCGDSLKIRKLPSRYHTFEVFNGKDWVRVDFWPNVDRLLNRLFKKAGKRVLHVLMES